MERDPGIERDEAADATVRSGDDLAWIASVQPCPGIPQTEQEVLAAIADADRDVAAGRTVPHEAVARWVTLRSSTGHEPMPREWLE